MLIIKNLCLMLRSCASARSEDMREVSAHENFASRNITPSRRHGH
ncbi:hypothetical protein HMPREF0281_00453 [Corynebacterium ammoniagenes DSM 20306]|uniref:Uncharacterized protein n=1 Tax=Corynebacterium ammoniagenes DSM 20306 TaxID=649754 RepID=A0ABP2IGE0_CORAM|nr:hypothetical protein HMPREF0281_00453 [Corynebacterium ammoniagenes DSM 20306]